ncbi:hypothetical protein GGX14DRAFT_385318 [Mycena pura]|uniref:Uncharacterized protein n=1 Tax=Mycena pura TaxID=153505 RepID=A0AAD6YTW7_9AGAR|nr:hypothetical protein GGX14DRAFT_385318 [Mycena pura]
MTRRAANPGTPYPWSSPGYTPNFNRLQVQVPLAPLQVEGTASENGNSSATLLPITGHDDLQVNDADAAAYRLLSSPPSQGSNAILDDKIPSDSEDMGPSSPTTTSHGKRKDVKGRRVRITKKNPLYGMVQGAMRGGKAVEFPRTKELPTPIMERASASARFQRLSMDIIDRCERLSVETGCWLQFSAQHMFANAPFLHYASPRILKEAKQDVEQITNHLNRVYLNLIAARNAESREMHKKLIAAEMREKDAQEALVASQLAQQQAAEEAEIAQKKLEHELETQRLELDVWRAQLKLAQQKSNPSLT